MRTQGKLAKIAEANEVGLREAAQGVHDSALAETQARQEGVEEARKRTAARAKMQR